MRSRKIIFLVLLFIIQLSIIWPVYSLFSGIHPMILGFPLSFAWIVAMLFASFFLLLWYYWSDPARHQTRTSDKAGDH
ncbi:hypothetical protein [Fodinibius sp.]|uniref:hypothetical protein n=1 Tax=Fodinibius sp. TaxID=1872440 RepID=UPI003569C25B